MKRSLLAAARIAAGMSQKEIAAAAEVHRNTYSQWELNKIMPYPLHIGRLCEIFGKTAEELGLLTNQEVVEKKPRLPTGPIEEILQGFTTGIAASVELAEHGAHHEMLLAARIAGTYMPALQAILNDSAKHRLQAATLISKLLQVQQGSAYHLEGLEQSLTYAEESLKYARLSKSPTDTVIALHHLATLYEWPLPGASVVASRKRGLVLLEEATHIQEKPQSNVPAVIQAWTYIGLAKFQALCTLKQEAYTSIGKANDAYAKGGDNVPGLYFNETNLVRQEAICHSYLNEQPQAVSTFLRLLDVSSAQIAPTMPMPARTHLSTVSETVFSLLKLPSAKKDRELTIKLWLNERAEARAMQSATYLKEAQTTYGIMECVWPDDPSVLELKDTLYS